MSKTLNLFILLFLMFFFVMFFLMILLKAYHKPPSIVIYYNIFSKLTSRRLSIIDDKLFADSPFIIGESIWRSYPSSSLNNIVNVITNKTLLVDIMEDAPVMVTGNIRNSQVFFFNALGGGEYVILPFENEFLALTVGVDGFVTLQTYDSLNIPDSQIFIFED